MARQNTQYLNWVFTIFWASMATIHAATPPAGVPTQTTCQGRTVDIAFLLDASSSEGPANFQTQVDFMKSVVTGLDVGPQASQVSLTTFSSNPFHVFDLDQYTDKASLLTALNNVPYNTGGTSTGLALDYVRTNVFTAAAGARNGVPKVLILLTDGQSANPTDTALKANQLKSTGVYVTAVGVGQNINMNELQAIATDSSSVITVADFNDLLNNIQQITQPYCQHIALSTTPAPCQNRAVDIAFLLDASSSEGPANFQTQVDFMKSVVTGLDVGPQATQVSLTTFSTATHHVFDLNQYSDKTSMLTALNNVPYHSGGTNTAIALDYVRTNVFTAAGGARNGVPKVLILLTDGQSASQTETEQKAKQLKSTGVYVTAVGVGQNINMNELQAIATDSSAVITVTDFNDLLNNIQQITQPYCQHIAQVASPAPCQSRQTDIGFLVDSSTSVGSVNFQKQVDSIKSFVSGLTIGPNANQVGLVTFSTDPRLEFSLDQYSSKADVLSALNNVQENVGHTRTHLGLRFMRTQFFNSSAGSRSGVPQNLIVMTDGNSNNAALTAQEATLLKDQGVYITVVGIGNKTNLQELRTIASEPSAVVQVPDFADLPLYNQNVTDAYCQHMSAPPTTAAPCQTQEVEIGFLLDNSTSEGPINFQRQLDFVVAVVAGLRIGPQAAQVGLVTFATYPLGIFTLDKYSDKADVLHALNSRNVPSNEGHTRTERALEYMRTNFFTPSAGVRSGAPKTLILLTDGRSLNATKTAEEAQLLRDSGVYITAVGIGNKINLQELQAVASEPSAVVTVVDTSDLLNNIDFITNHYCAYITGISTTATP